MLPSLKLYFKRDLTILRVPYFWNFINLFFLILIVILALRDEIISWISYFFILVCLLSLFYQEKWIYQKKEKRLVHKNGFFPFLREHSFIQSHLKEIRFSQVGRYFLIILSTCEGDWEIERSIKKNQLLKLALKLSEEWKISLR